MHNTNKFKYRLLLSMLLFILIAITKVFGQCNLNVSPSTIIFTNVGQSISVSVSGGCNYSISAERNFRILKTIDGSELIITYNSEFPSGAPTIYNIKLIDPNNSSNVFATITVNVSPMILKGGSINIATTSVISGESPGTFTNSGSPIGGSGSYSYQWQRSTNGTSWTNITSATGLTYNCPDLDITTSFRRRVISGAATAYSNTIQITVVDPPPPQAPAINPSTNQNYILTKTMLNDASTSSLNKVDYFDGLGRPTQTVLHGASPEGNDLVTLQEYDGAGRPSHSYLAVPVLSSTGAYVAPSTIKTRASGFYSDTRAFKESIYEPSPLNRVEKVYGPGAAWHSNDKAITTTRHTNTPTGELSCALYAVATDSSIKRTGLYSSGELYVTKTIGEDGHISFTFTDKLGQTVLERVMNGTQRSDTYYVYDDLGNLRYVLPPSASDMLTATTTWMDDNETLKNYVYVYKYDGRNRCTQKRLPGCEPIEVRYDKADRLIFSQDGNQREDNKWLFHFYDVFGRQTVSGVWNSDNIPDLSDMVVRTSFNTSGTNIGGYEVNLALPTVNLMTVTYYDNYDFISGITDLHYINPPSVYDTKHHSAKGLLTGTRTYRLDNPSEYTISTVYYDHRGRIVQTHSTNHMGGYDHEYFAYTFTGKIKQQQTVHTGDISTDAQTETYYYDFETPETNPTERLLSVRYKLNDAAQVTLAQYSYDEVGRIRTKTLASETTNYSYNVRSWLTQINGSKFNQTLTYNTAVNGITPTNALYSGNISALKWRAGDESTERGYKFTYDNLNRLTDANYGEGTSIASNPNRFNENISYDKMGNITTLQRQGKITSSTYNLIDNLTYTYTGNKLTKVYDAVTSPVTNESTLHFVDGANEENEYLYDANGNLIKDLNKNITLITYNYLNLPNVITFADGNSITYDYDAKGSKLSVAYKIGDNIAKTEYVGNKVYKNGTLSMILTEEGYITMNGTTPTYHYFLKDHQGNNRVVMNQNGTVEQVNHYYPFGGLFGEGLQDSNQPYKYNGKEFDNLLGLNMYDYGARHYDPYSGRWINVDPLSEKYYSISPYVYVANNPIKYIDPDGRKVVFVNGSTKEFKKAFGQAVRHLNKYGAGGMLAQLEKSEKVYYISETSKSSSYDRTTSTIKWDPTKGLITNEAQELSPTTILNHEVDHALQHDKNPQQQRIDIDTKDAQYENKEERRVIEGSEQETAKKLGEIKKGEVTRKDYGGTLYETISPTSNKWKEELIIAPQKNEKNK